MKDIHKENIIKSAIREYRESVSSGFSMRTMHAIDIMEEVYQMCLPLNIEGITKLRRTIDEAKEKYKEELNSVSDIKKSYDAWELEH